MNKLYLFVFIFFWGAITGCFKKNIESINIGYIGPLSTRATDLGVAPAKAMELAVEEYNLSRPDGAPKVMLHIEDDQWEKSKSLPAYEKLRKKHKIDILLISNTDGTVAVQNKLLEDKVICVNPLNSDELLSSLNKNTFKIAKRTEDANALVAVRISELGLKKVLIFHYPNDFMTRGANAAKAVLDESGVYNEIHLMSKGKKNYEEELSKAKAEGFDAYVFFGYQEFGFAMKQARQMGITAPFFGSTVLLTPEFYDNSEGAIVGSEFPFFTSADGNYILAHEFLQKYGAKYGESPFSVWPPLQAYDAINILLNEIRQVNESIKKSEHFSDWLRRRLHKVQYYQGVCGNISIDKDGASKGIYFSLYSYKAKGKIAKVKR